jgi:8-amino-7-oxononanoate synthase
MAIDFRSSLYLGMRHPNGDLQSWQRLTTGGPALLNEPPINREIARKVAALQGMEHGILAPSTLHLWLDFFQAIDRNTVLLIDEQAYPLMDWISRLATGRGIKVLNFPTQQIAKLRLLLQMHVQPGQVPFILCDGWNPISGQASPLRQYLDLLRPFRGYLVVDDTQALGILGKNADSGCPLGYGGRGTLAWQGISSPYIVSICSLAKGFGVPVAVMSGASAFIQPFEQKSLSRIHCSQVSAPLAAAALNALQHNGREGDRKRAYLYRLINHFKKVVQPIGIELRGGIFPVQTLKLPTTQLAMDLFGFLQKNGFSALLLRGEGANQTPLISFCITVEQNPRQYGQLGQCIRHFWTNNRLSSYAKPEPVYRF